MRDKNLYNKMENIESYPKGYMHLENIETFKDISIFLKENIYYKSEYPDKWSSPKTVLERGYGDCEDYAILFMDIAYYCLGIKVDLVIVNISNRRIVNGQRSNHADIYYNGEIFSVMRGIYYQEDLDIQFLYTYSEVFY